MSNKMKEVCEAQVMFCEERSS